MDIETAKLAREAVRALNALICAGERHPNIVEADYLVNSWAERFQTDGEWNIPDPDPAPRFNPFTYGAYDRIPR